MAFPGEDNRRWQSFQFTTPRGDVKVTAHAVSSPLIKGLRRFGAAVIALRYVVPRVVRPIERITEAMSGLAAGDTSIDVPGRDRSDEIGHMSHAGVVCAEKMKWDATL